MKNYELKKIYKNLKTTYKNGKTIIKFSDIEIKKLNFHQHKRGFIKTTVPPSHRPTDPPATYHLPTDLPTTYPLTNGLTIIKIVEIEDQILNFFCNL